MHIITFMDSVSGFELSSDEDEPSLQPENPDDIESNPMQPPMIGPLPVMLPQQPAPAAAAPFDFGSFMRETGGNTIAFLSAIQKADKHLPIGPIRVYSDRGGGGERLNIYFAYNTYSAYYVLTSARQGYLKGLFSLGWITSGSANFCSCSKFIQGQTQACSTVSVPMFLCWKSTQALGNQVIFCILCILCIF
jgi:hypothetical protein